MNSHAWRRIGILWRHTRHLLMGVLALVLVLNVAWGSTAHAQYASPSVTPGKGFDPERPWSFALSFGADKFFGFYPIIAGTYKLRKDFGIAFGSTVYQHLGSRGPLQSSIFSNPWIIVHAGIHKEFLDGRLIIRPEVGFTNGQILSAGNNYFGTTQNYTVFDGWLTKVSASYTDEWVESTVDAAYVGYWRKEGPAVSSYLHLVAYGGLRITKNIGFGPYYESLWMTADHSNVPGGALAEQDLYSWLGPAIRLKVPSLGMSLLVSGGVDLSHTLNNVQTGTTGAGATGGGPSTTVSGSQTCLGGQSMCHYHDSDYFKIIWTKTF